jgi:hypothetical protein
MLQSTKTVLNTASFLNGANTKIIKSMSEPKAEASEFKVLRAVDPAVIGGTTALGISKDIHFPNARGVLRAVSGGSEVRSIAKSSALTLMKALGKD